MRDRRSFDFAQDDRFLVVDSGKLDLRLAGGWGYEVQPFVFDDVEAEVGQGGAVHGQLAERHGFGVRGPAGLVLGDAIEDVEGVADSGRSPGAGDRRCAWERPRVLRRMPAISHQGSVRSRATQNPAAAIAGAPVAGWFRTLPIAGFAAAEDGQERRGGGQPLPEDVGGATSIGSRVAREFGAAEIDGSAGGGEEVDGLGDMGIDGVAGEQAFVDEVVDGVAEGLEGLPLLGGWATAGSTGGEALGGLELGKGRQDIRGIVIVLRHISPPTPLIGRGGKNFRRGFFLT